jgi:hypothetical protein
VIIMAHPASALFAFLGARLRRIHDEDRQPPEDEPGTPTPVHWDAERDRLPPRDESFYWAWQYWAQ